MPTWRTVHRQLRADRRGHPPDRRRRHDHPPLRVLNRLLPARRAQLGSQPVTPGAVRDEVRAWLAENWDPERPLARVAPRCWPTRAGRCPSWPREWYGRGLPGAGRRRRRRGVRAPPARSAPPVGAGIGLAAPTILAHGSDAAEGARCLRADHHRRGHVVPAVQRAGQRLRPGRAHHPGGARRRRVGRQRPEGVEHRAPTTPTYGMLLARTDWDVPKHRGITYFVLPMHQPGVEVRPLRQMNGHAIVQRGVPHRRPRSRRDHVVGEVGDGWRVALTTLAHERRLRPRHRRRAARRRRRWPAGSREADAEADEYFEHLRVVPAARRPRRPRHRAQARAHGRGRRPARAPARSPRCSRSQRVSPLDRRAGARPPGPPGEPPGAEGSLGKLAASDIARAAPPRPRDDRRRHGMLSGRTPTLGGVDRRGPRVGPGAVDRRRHRRDPAQHHRRAGARPARSRPSTATSRSAASPADAAVTTPAGAAPGRGRRGAACRGGRCR